MHFISNVLLYDKYKRTAVGRSLLLQLLSLLSLEKDSYRLLVECCVYVTLTCAHTLCCPCLWIYSCRHHRAEACDDLWIIDWTRNHDACDTLFSDRIASAQDQCVTTVKLCPYGHCPAVGSPDDGSSCTHEHIHIASNQMRELTNPAFFCLSNVMSLRCAIECQFAKTFIFPNVLMLAYSVNKSLIISHQ